jgi:hypothetical protein
VHNCTRFPFAYKESSVANLSRTAMSRAPGKPMAVPPVMILGAITYFDTVAIWLPRNLKRHEFETLGNLCLTKPQSLSAQSAGAAGQWMGQRGYRFKLTLSGPTPEAIRYLIQQTSHPLPPLITRLDPALDFLVPDLRSAESLQSFIHLRWNKPYHRAEHEVTVWQERPARKRSGRSVKSSDPRIISTARQRLLSDTGTAYTGFANWRTKHVVYSNELCRRTGANRTHLECRFQSSAAVRSLGINSLQDLAAFDLAAFWRKRLRFFQYDFEKLGKRFNDRHLNHAPRIRRTGRFFENLDARTGHRVARVASAAGALATVNELKVYAKTYGKSLNGILYEVSTEYLLRFLPGPPSNNV